MTRFTPPRSLLWIALGLFTDIALAAGIADIKRDGAACQQAFEEREYEEGIVLCRAAAKQGDHASAFRLGEAYEYGTGVKPSLQKAANWYRRAAAGNYPLAQRNLAALFERGDTGLQDYWQAFELYRKAALQGQIHSQYKVGLMYLAGFGVDADEAAGLEWIAKAADGGLSEAKVFAVEYLERVDAKARWAKEKLSPYWRRPSSPLVLDPPDSHKYILTALDEIIWSFSQKPYLVRKTISPGTRRHVVAKSAPKTESKAAGANAPLVAASDDVAARKLKLKIAAATAMAAPSATAAATATKATNATAAATVTKATKTTAVATATKATNATAAVTVTKAAKTTVAATATKVATVTTAETKNPAVSPAKRGVVDTRNDAAVPPPPPAPVKGQAKLLLASNGGTLSDPLITMSMLAPEPVEAQSKPRLEAANKAAPIVSSGMTQLKADKAVAATTVAKAAKVAKVAKVARAEPSPREPAAASLLASHSPGHFTVQLALMGQAASVERFYRIYGMHDQVKPYRTQLQGKPFYLLIYGDFSSYAEAKAAAEALPAKVQELNPWVRRYETLQKDYPQPEANPA